MTPDIAVPALGERSPISDRMYVDAAASLMADGGAGRRGWWPRAVVWLLRIQLEGDIATQLAAHGVPLVDSEGRPISGRAKLLMLHRTMPSDEARDIAALWTALSEAGHHHSYELAPTHGELTRWLEGVRSSAIARD